MSTSDLCEFRVLRGPITIIQAMAGVTKFTRSEERGCGFVLRENFNRLNCTSAVLSSALNIDSSLLPSLVPSLK